MKYKVVLAVCIVAITTAALAQIKPEDQIKFRQSGYTFMAWNMGKIKNQVVEHPETYNKEQVIAAANVIAAISSSGMGALFSPESATGKGWKETRVKPEFFQQPDEVKKHAMALNKEAKALVQVADSGDIGAIKTQFTKVFDACKGCHDNFRTKD
jgi:cytochrome c556